MVEQQGVHATSAVVVAPVGEARPRALPPAPLSNTRRLSTRVRVVVSAVAVVFVVLNVLVVRDLVVTNSTSTQVRTAQANANGELADARRQLASLRIQVTRATAELVRHTESRDVLRASESTTRQAAAKTDAAVQAALAQAQAQLGQAGLLAGCLMHLQAALNAVSGGDTGAATAALAGIDPACPGAVQ